MKRIHKIVTIIMIAVIIMANKAAIVGATVVSVPEVTVTPGVSVTPDVTVTSDVSNQNTGDTAVQNIPQAPTVNNLVYARVRSFVNIRSKAGLDGKILGRLYNNFPATVISKENGWYLAKAGAVTGYIKADYLISGENTMSLSRALMTNNIPLGTQIADYALQFNGNPYVWGGTNLTNGADCSGFTQSVFAHFGITLPRTSRTQAAVGVKILMNDLRPGDLIFYTKYGTIDHVAIYIGNGNVISASSRATGIRISSYDYRKPYKAVRYMN